MQHRASQTETYDSCCPLDELATSEFRANCQYQVCLAACTRPSRSSPAGGGACLRHRLPSPAGKAAWFSALLTTSLPASSHHRPAALRAATNSVCRHAAVIRQGRVPQPLPRASLPSGSLSCPAAPAARDSAGRGTQTTLGLVGCNSLLRRKAIARLCIRSAGDF